MSDSIEPPQLKVSTGWIDLLVLGEPSVKMTIRGYAPVIKVKATKTGLDYLLFISAKSVAVPLDALRATNERQFTGLRFSIRKSGASPTDPYEIRVSD